MIDAAGILRLLGTRSPDPGVVSVYVTVPLVPAQRRGMPAHIESMLTAAPGPEPQGQQGAWKAAVRREVPRIKDEVSTLAQEHAGRSAAIFACSPLGLLESVALRRPATERAVVAERPYVRPLIAEVRRCPSYLAAVVDRRHAWLFRVTPEGISEAGHVESATMGSRRFAGWHGLAAYRNSQRSRGLTRRHFAAASTAAMRASGGRLPLVVGGHEAETTEFVETLAPEVRGRLAGTFVVDPHTMTPTRVRQLGDDAVAAWEDERERRLAASLADETPGTVTARGLDACVAAANDHAIGVLLIPDDDVRSGYRCGSCDRLALVERACPVCGGQPRLVNDIIEELAVQAMLAGGTVEPVSDTGALGGVAARRRFPAASTRAPVPDPATRLPGADTD